MIALGATGYPYFSTIPMTEQRKNYITVQKKVKEQQSRLYINNEGKEEPSENKAPEILPQRRR